MSDRLAYLGVASNLGVLALRRSLEESRSQTASRYSGRRRTQAWSENHGEQSGTARLVISALTRTAKQTLRPHEKHAGEHIQPSGRSSHRRRRAIPGGQGARPPSSCAKTRGVGALRRQSTAPFNWLRARGVHGTAVRTQGTLRRPRQRSRQGQAPRASAISRRIGRGDRTGPTTCGAGHSSPGRWDPHRSSV